MDRHGLQSGQIKAMRLSQSGVAQFMWEALMKLGHEIFDEQGQQSLVFGMKQFDDSDSLLIYVQKTDDALRLIDHDDLLLHNLYEIAPLVDSAFDTKESYHTFVIEDVLRRK